ncbi:MAG TPA: amino acid adenylation domain-containing protein, partial [Pyrinomonadaceae bacterium]
DDERRQLLLEWNSTQSAYPRHSCIHQLFAEQAARTPDAIALQFGAEQMSYGELNGRANQLGRYLRRLGVGPEEVVGISMERSMEMVVGLLGILKAGGGYVPLDGSYPVQRQAEMIADGRVKVVVTKGGVSEGLREKIEREVRIEEEWEGIGEEEREGEVESGAGSGNVAYVIYTSGSTGRSKGVSVTHQSVIRLVCNTNYVTLSPSDVIAQVSNSSFDAATFEIWGALLHGARLVGIDRDVSLSTKDFAAQIREHGINTMFLTTSLFNQMASEEPTAFASVRNLLIGGEAADPSSIRDVLRHGPPERLLNVYGPTESTTFTSWHLVEQVAEDATTVPIGCPLSNTSIFLLDGSMQPVPVGVAGELYIGGDGLARGYLYRPELTAETFVPHPYSAEPGQRLYKTGDLARYLPDGNIEFIGRNDAQVKVRGFRIELGEIEATLGSHASVQDAVVLARDEGRGDKRLVAYVATGEAQPLTPGELRRHLKEKLPEYMMPSAFVMLEKLPLTPNGKVDRQALPALDHERPELDATFATPQTPTEEMLAGIWADVLKLERIGIDDDFFELGGHSLLATQLISRVREIFHVELPLRSLFETPTVAGLADRIEHEIRIEPALAAPPIVAVSRDQKLPLSFSQQRLWFLDQLEPGGWMYNIPAAVRLTGRLDVAALEQTFREISRRHEALRTNFSMTDGQAVQVVYGERLISLPVVDLGDLPETERESEAERLIAEESQQPFDLEHGSLIRVFLLRLEEEDHVLAVTMHHIISDGWSIGVLIKEMATLYEAFSAGQPSPLPELPIQYADFAHWQREWLQGDVLDAQLSYWKRQLAGAPPLLELPTDRPRPAVQTYNGAHLSLSLPLPLCAALRSLCRDEGVTLFMAMLAAFQTLLYRYTGEEDIVVSTGIANRMRAEVEPLIGFFVNTLVLRTDLGGSPSFRELLKQVREVTLGAYAHQDVPFELIVEAMQPERNPSYTPIFQVMMVLQNAPLERMEVPGLEIRQVGGEGKTAKFDLTMF